MPNTLAHVGVQVLTSRAALRDAELRWVLVGCVVPDVPWILNRALVAFWPSVDVFVVRPYWIAQASWLCSLLLCGALASLAARPLRIFCLLAVNAFLHLLLDAAQTKWGNGVHLLAPFSWETWNLGLFWPESVATVVLTLLGLGVLLFALSRSPAAPAVQWPRRGRLALTLGLVAAYLAAPLLFRDAVLEADAHSLATLQTPELRPGRSAGFDRVWIEVDAPDRGRLFVLGGQTLEVVGALPSRSGPVSVRGRFLTSERLQIEGVHGHGAFPRELASYVGLGGIAAVWAAAFLAAWRRGQG